MRNKLQFLKYELQKKEPEFSEIWKVREKEVRETHYHREFPAQYIFLLTCCFQKDCPHPLCKEGPPADELTWFPDGPTFDFVLQILQDLR